MWGHRSGSVLDWATGAGTGITPGTIIIIASALVVPEPGGSTVGDFEAVAGGDSLPFHCARYAVPSPVMHGVIVSRCARILTVAATNLRLYFLAYPLLNHKE